MADQTGELRCAVITPDRQVLDVAVSSVVLPAYDGLIGILRGRAPLLCKLGIGIVRLVTGGKEQRLFVDGGFAQVRDNNVTVLTSAAMAPEEINRQSAQAGLQAALSMRITDDQSFQARSDAITRAKTQLALAAG